MVVSLGPMKQRQSVWNTVLVVSVAMLTHFLMAIMVDHMVEALFKHWGMRDIVVKTTYHT